jgi:CubicO group peptidase (beta-lactamase class C family)
MGATHKTLTEAAAEVAALVDADARYSRVTDMLFARGTEVVAHHNWPASHRTDRHDLFSVTKTVMALITGIAIADGLVALDRPAATAPRLTSFPQLRGVSVRHLLTMTLCGAVLWAAYPLVHAHKGGASLSTIARGCTPLQ